MNPSVPSDMNARKFPVSVKGVLICDEHVLLLRNERDEWELPGGKLELHEEPHECLTREILEETSIAAQVTRPLRSYIYWINNSVPVLIVPYLCACQDFSRPKVSEEHKEIGVFRLTELDGINLPIGYRLTIQSATERLLP